MTDETRQKLDEVIQEAEVDPAALTDWHLAVLRAARDRIAELKRDRDQANESWHYANGVAELAMKHRDDAEAECERLAAEVNAAYSIIQRYKNATNVLACGVGKIATPDGFFGDWNNVECDASAFLHRTALAADQQGEREDETAHGPNYDAGWNAAMEEARHTALGYGSLQEKAERIRSLKRGTP